MGLNGRRFSKDRGRETLRKIYKPVVGALSRLLEVVIPFVALSASVETTILDVRCTASVRALTAAAISPIGIATIMAM